MNGDISNNHRVQFFFKLQMIHPRLLFLIQQINKWNYFWGFICNPWFMTLYEACIPCFPGSKLPLPLPSKLYDQHLFFCTDHFDYSCMIATLESFLKINLYFEFFCRLSWQGKILSLELNIEMTLPFLVGNWLMNLVACLILQVTLYK